MWKNTLIRYICITQSTMTAVLKLPTASISTRNVSSKTSIGIIFAAVPIICVYPFIQKYFVQGTMVGAVKG